MYIYVYMSYISWIYGYTNVYICIHVHIYILNIWVYKCIYVWTCPTFGIHVIIYTQIYLNTYMYVCMYALISDSSDVWIWKHVLYLIYMWLYNIYTHISQYIYVCMYVRTHFRFLLCHKWAPSPTSVEIHIQTWIYGYIYIFIYFWHTYRETPFTNKHTRTYMCIC